MANITQEDSKSQSQDDVYDKEASHHNILPQTIINHQNQNKAKYAMEEKEEKEKEDSINTQSDFYEDNEDNNCGHMHIKHNLGDKIRDNFASISRSFLNKYDKLLENFNVILKENNKLKTVRKQQDETIKILNEEIFKLNQQIIEQQLSSPSNDNDIKSMDEYHQNEDINVAEITPEPTDSDDKPLSPSDLILDTDLLLDEDDNIHEADLDPLMSSESYIQISVNGTPIAATHTLLTYEQAPNLITRTSLRSLIGSNVVKNLTEQFEERNDNILEKLNEENEVDVEINNLKSPQSRHVNDVKTIDKSQRQQSLSNSHSFRTTTKAKHKNKKKPKNAKVHRTTYETANFDARPMKRNNTLDKNIPTQVNVSPRISIEKIVPVPSKVRIPKLTKRPTTKSLGVKKPRFKSKKSSSPRHNNGYKAKTKQKQKARAPPMLNSKSRTPSIMQLFGSGKKQKKKSKK